ncbi:MliC family protein [Pseudomonas aeruginosa]
MAASGARYASGQYVWWTKGPTGFLADETLPGGRNQLYRDCSETTSGRP